MYKFLLLYKPFRFKFITYDCIAIIILILLIEFYSDKLIFLLPLFIGMLVADFIKLILTFIYKV